MINSFFLIFSQWQQGEDGQLRGRQEHLLPHSTQGNITNPPFITFNQTCVTKKADAQTRESFPWTVNVLLHN